MAGDYHRILVPVDFSACSREAYGAALMLARQFGAEIQVLHVIDIHVAEALAGIEGVKKEALLKKMRRRVRERLREFLQGHPSEVAMRRTVAVGFPFQEIVKAAREGKADLIVIGRFGGTGELEKIFFGSTAEKVVRISPCAVLTVPLTGAKAA